MTLTVVGSIAFDAVETLSGRRDKLLGGSAVHFALASSFLAETRVVGPVGDDFGPEEYEVLRRRGVVTDDIEHVPGGQTFFWAGRYERDVNIRHTIQTDLNVFEHFQPKLSEASRASETVVLAKQGEYGASMYTADGVFGLPAYPTADVVDPTGAGDTFAGGFMGYIAAHIDEGIGDDLLRRAMAYGTALASFNVEAFGTERIQTLTGEEIHERVSELERVTRFDAGPVPLRT